MAERKVRVVIPPGRVVYVDGVAYLPSQELELDPAEAKALIDQGDAERVGAAGK